MILKDSVSSGSAYYILELYVLWAIVGNGTDGISSALASGVGDLKVAWFWFCMYLGTVWRFAFFDGDSF